MPNKMRLIDVISFDKDAKEAAKIVINRDFANASDEEKQEIYRTFGVFTAMLYERPYIDHIPRDWTPCAEGMPDADDAYSTQPKKLYWCATACYISGKQRVDYAALLYLRYDGREPFWCYHGSMQNLDAGDTVLAWQPLPAPYRADDTMGKVKEDAE